MIQPLGRAVTRAWPFILFGWIGLAALVISAAPDWTAVTVDGEFVFLPENSPSNVAQDLYRRAFPGSLEGSIEDDSKVQQNPLGSTIVLIVRRTDLPSGLTEDDLNFIEEVLRPELEQIARTTGRGYYMYHGLVEVEPEAAGEPIARGIWTWEDTGIGALLRSDDGRAALVLIELTTEFLDRSNSLLIHKVEELVREMTSHRNWKGHNITGLDLAISGSATVGRDMLVAEQASAAKTEWFTKVLVIVLLLVIYRAPILALIPLMTVGLAVEVTIRLLRLMAGEGWIGLFNGIEIYVTVVVYGAGVDYCLFLIARYKEELERGLAIPDAIAAAVRQVGTALATSAGTSIFGIGMMTFAEFGKFQQAGFAIAFGLLVVLCASVTFTPALLLLSGRWAFWPDIRSETVTPEAEWRPRFSLLSHLQERRWLEQLWERIAALLTARPATVLLVCIAIMAPFAGVAVVQHDHLSYGLLSDLPQEDASVVGAKAIQRHFAAGITGSTTVLLHNPRLDIPSGAAGSTPGEIFAAALTESLNERSSELNIVDIRSQKDPLGTVAPLKSFGDLLKRTLLRNQALKTYLSGEGELAGDVVRLDLVFNIDPFSRDSIEQLTQAELALRDALPIAYEALLQDRWQKEQYERQLEDAHEFSQAPGDGDADIPPPIKEKLRNQAESLADETEVWSVGPTASIRDLKNVTDRDQVRIFVLVVAAVYFVLIALLRKPAICGFLIVSVVFSYLVTMGVTFTVFWARDPAGFAGLDWKVPIFLFTILIAMGEDYNILLMARVEEEQRTRPPVDGVLTALIKTGSIISSCGVIMAGTFSTLMTGSLLGMVELGFALAFGVLLDTFVIRPIVVPAYLVLLHRGRFGKLGPWLGARTPSEVPPPKHMSATVSQRESRSVL